MPKRIYATRRDWRKASAIVENTAAPTKITQIVNTNEFAKSPTPKQRASACKPGSVEDDHLSRIMVAHYFLRPTQISCE